MQQLFNSTVQPVTVRTVKSAEGMWRYNTVFSVAAENIRLHHSYIKARLRAWSDIKSFSSQPLPFVLYRVSILSCPLGVAADKGAVNCRKLHPLGIQSTLRLRCEIKFVEIERENRLLNSPAVTGCSSHCTQGHDKRDTLYLITFSGIRR